MPDRIAQLVRRDHVFLAREQDAQAPERQAHDRDRHRPSLRTTGRGFSENNVGALRADRAGGAWVRLTPVDWPTRCTTRLAGRTRSASPVSGVEAKIDIVVISVVALVEQAKASKTSRRTIMLAPETQSVSMVLSTTGGATDHRLSSRLTSPSFRFPSTLQAAIETERPSVAAYHRGLLGGCRRFRPSGFDP